MQDKLFDTPEKKELGVKLFTELEMHPGWALFVKVVEANIEALKLLLENPIDENDVAEAKRTRDRIKIYREMISMPQDRVKDLSRSNDGIDPDIDPYPQRPEASA